jgi:Fic family protein
VNVASALLDLLSLPGVEQAAADARADLDALLWNRQLLKVAESVGVEVAARSVRASAALDGADVSLASVRSGAAFDGSPMGRVVAAASAMRAELPALGAVQRTAPMQAWARLAALAGTGVVPDADLGRPRSDDRVEDPLHLGAVPPAHLVPARLEQLARIAVESTAPAVVVSAVVHGELLALRPFSYGSGLVARAAARLVLAARGVDKDFLSVPEAGVLGAGRPTYVSCAREFAGGSPEGVGRWIVFWCAALHEGAIETGAIAAEIDAG